MASSPQAVLCRYHYDPLDRLAGATPLGQPDALRFYQKNRLATQIQGAVQRTIIQHEDLLLVQQQRIDSAIETTLLATDQQRSVLHLLDYDDTQSLAYNPYGHFPAESGIPSLLGFNGEHRDPVTGHYLLGNGYRAFNPVLMRFNSPDSLSPFDEGGINAYAYCQGDPVNYVDPSGHMFGFGYRRSPTPPPMPRPPSPRVITRWSRRVPNSRYVEELDPSPPMSPREARSSRPAESRSPQAGPSVEQAGPSQLSASSSVISAPAGMGFTVGRARRNELNSPYMDVVQRTNRVSAMKNSKIDLQSVPRSLKSARSLLKQHRVHVDDRLQIQVETLRQLGPDDLRTIQSINDTFEALKNKTAYEQAYIRARGSLP